MVQAESRTTHDSALPSVAAGQPPPARTLHAVHALRFFASLGVIIHHSLTAFGPALTGVLAGAAGVDVFFVISGVVIGYADHSAGAPSFALKRLIRLYPLYWLATLAYALVRHGLFGEVPPWARLGHSFLLLPDFTQADWVPIYYPAWTLSFEVAFYLIFGLLLPLAKRATTLSAACLCCALAVVQIPVPFAAGAAFNTAYCLEFAAGLAVAEALHRGFRVPPKIGVLCLALSAAVFFVHRHGPSGTRVLDWGVPAALLVVGVLGLENHAVWRSKFLVLGGSASYALYLVHITIMEPLLARLERAGLDLHSRIRFILLREAILLSAAVAGGILVHLAVERPVLSGLRRLLLPRPVA